MANIMKFVTHLSQRIIRRLIFQRLSVEKEGGGLLCVILHIRMMSAPVTGAFLDMGWPVSPPKLGSAKGFRPKVP